MIPSLSFPFLPFPSLPESLPFPESLSLPTLSSVGRRVKLVKINLLPVCVDVNVCKQILMK